MRSAFNLKTPFGRKRRKLKTYDDLNMLLGEVLRQKHIISEDQLQSALNEQYDRISHLGHAEHLGRIIVEQGFATEQTLVQAINEHYHLKLTSLSDDIVHQVRQKRKLIAGKLPTRMPIWLQLSVATTLITVTIIFSLSFVMLTRQKERLYEQMVRIGTVSLNYFSTNSRIPMLEENTLRLNTLIKDAANVEGLVYAIIVDNDDQIQAHTDYNKIGTPMPVFRDIGKINRDGDITYFTCRLPSGKQVLNLTRPIRFKDKKLGAVHVGVSIDQIEEAIRKEQFSVLLMSLFFTCVGVVVAVFYGRRFSRPISRLVVATQETAQGNYRHRIELARRDELGNLARAFNRMNEELLMNSLMQKSFGKYVGTEVLEMIMANPESAWLKGHRKEATIVFADIRGFTAYSEEKDPEEIVVELNQYFEIATRAILDRDGYIDKFIGDAVLGVFGIPVNSKNHVKRALQAACNMQKKFQEASRRGNPLLTSVGIGIDTGVVVSGNIGSQVKMEYTVIGDAVNVASHISQIAGPGEVIISRNAYERLLDAIEVEALPTQRIKGKSELVETYRVLSIKEQGHAKALETI